MPTSPRDEPREPSRPPVVPGYHLDRLLGRGGSGEVWQAVPRSGGDPVAVKVLVAGDPERQAREAALLGELDHPHLVRLLEVVHQPRRGGEPRVALVLELLPGGSLAALLARRGRLRPGEVVTAIAPVAAALAHAHERGVIHGDLSPGNIVFTAEGRPVLTDLGVARVLGESAAGEITPAYVDPTVARGGAPGPASDVFGVAAAAFHALTGVAPWNAATPADTLHVAAGGTLPDLAELAPDAPAELVAVVARGLSADPHERGSAAAFALDLRHACRPEPVRLPVPGVPDDELGRTGRGPRTELTHRAPGRHRLAAPVVEPAGRRGLRDRGPGAGTPLRRTGVLAAAVVVLAAVVWTGSRWGQPAEPGTRPAAGVADAVPPLSAEAAPAGPAGDGAEARAGGAADPAVVEPSRVPDSAAGWGEVLTELYERRAAAFASASPETLTDVHAPGSPLLAADRGLVEALRAAGERLRGFAPTVVRVDSAEGPDAEGRVTLQIVDTWAPYEVVASAAPEGPPSRSVEGREAAQVRMTLVGTDAGWRIEAAERVG
ncbi:serine/threonine-protein kinase [Geodermatophilus ruber]|uniref:non-specific serine/threonine protein kinase n=1 Tax=Geodermatophilus ruber TaxID=504800 RepID=A0A1I4ATH8_9ACTN|nr:serine/threonine-protein kinase [Geodermatophilus ruber]SFK59019.1 Serine/threonine protein kinase [Geodermatophilus ruber]